MNKVTCISGANFPQALTRGQQYNIVEIDKIKRQVKIVGDNQRMRWFPFYCFDFTGAEVPLLRHFKIIDTIDKPLTTAVEVEIELSNGEKRWCFFVTPELLGSMGDYIDGTNIRIHFGAAHMIVVSEIDEEIIDKALQQIEREGELIDCTKSIE